VCSRRIRSRKSTRDSANRFHTILTYVSMQGCFRFGNRTVFVPPPEYPPGAAAFEHQRALGISVLPPTLAPPTCFAMTGSSTLTVAAPTPQPAGLNTAFMPAMTAYKVWPCSQRLGEWLHSHHAPPLAGKAILELGAGCGLAGFAAWLAGAAHVCLTDLDENLPRLQQLVNLNAATPHVTVTSLDWTVSLPHKIATTAWDMVICADCIFWPVLFEPFLSTINALCVAHKSPPRVFLAMTDRLGRAQEFAAVARAAGWLLIALEEDARPLPAHSLEVMKREACELFELVRCP